MKIKPPADVTDFELCGHNSKRTQLRQGEIDISAGKMYLLRFFCVRIFRVFKVIAK